VPAGGEALFPAAGAVPPVPFFAGTTGRVAGTEPGADGEFLPASTLGLDGVTVFGGVALGGAALGAAGFFPAAGAVPPVPSLAGAPRRVAGPEPGADSEFLPASTLGLDGVTVLGGTTAAAGGFFPVAGAVPAV
jgi:hypothetical protein